MKTLAQRLRQADAGALADLLKEAAEAIETLQADSIENLRDRGYAVIVWNPEEIGHGDVDQLVDISIERGNLYLEEFNDED